MFSAIFVTSFGFFTVTLQVAVLPPFFVFTVMVAVPFFTGVTTPSATVATFGSEDFHVTVLSAAAGLMVGVSANVLPRYSVAEVLFSAIDVGRVGSFTVSVSVRVVFFLSFIVTVMVAVPAAFGVTTGTPSFTVTVATLVLELFALLAFVPFRLIFRYVPRLMVFLAVLVSVTLGSAFM